MPVVIEPKNDSDEISLTLLESNADRPKGMMERLQEFGAHREISERILRRQYALHGNPPEGLVKAVCDRAIAQAAQRLGLTREEAKRGISLLELIADPGSDIEPLRSTFASLERGTITDAYQHAVANGLINHDQDAGGSRNLKPILAK